MHRDEMRKRSSQMLGTAYRLEIASWINEHAPDTVSALSLAQDTEIFYARVQQELKRLVAAGLLVQRERRQTVEYKPVSSVYWRFCAELRAELEGTSGDSR